MIQIAVVEDQPEAAVLLEGYLNEYQKSAGETFVVKRFSDAVSFLSDYRPDYDIVFMDIEMPNLNGMDAAFRLRKIDRNVILIFVTNMAQFAVKGYEVNALDYILKPVGYQNFALKLKKALGVIKAGEQIELLIRSAGGIRRVSAKDVYYIEVTRHKLNYYLASEVLLGSGSLSELEEKLSKCSFMRCNNCYLVNPKHIVAVKGYDVTMRNGAVLQISHPRKKSFMNELANWLGQGNFI